MTDTNNLTSIIDKKMKAKIYLYLALFGIAGIGLAVFMTYCQVHHTSIVEIINNAGGINVLSSNAVDSSFPKILTYFENNAVTTVFSWCCVLAALMAVVLPIFTIPKCDLGAETGNSIFTVFASSLIGFLFAGYVVNYIITPLRPLWTKVQLPGPDFSAMTPMLKLIYYIGIAMAIPCAVYFLLIATKDKLKPDNKMCVLSVFPVIWLALRLVFYFMSTSAHVNLSGRKLFIVSMVLAIVFFIQDAKRWVSKDSSETSIQNDSKNSKIFFASGFASIVTFSAYHLSTTYLQAFWVATPEDSYLLNGIFISMILFIAFRIASVKKFS